MSHPSKPRAAGAAGPMGHCPQCRRPSLIAPENPWRPFCSERCKLVDLGDWMSGRFVIPAEPSEGDESELDYDSGEPAPRQ